MSPLGSDCSTPKLGGKVHAGRKSFVIIQYRRAEVEKPTNGSTGVLSSGSVFAKKTRSTGRGGFGGLGSAPVGVVPVSRRTSTT